MENTRLRGSLADLTRENQELREKLAAKPRETKPPEEMIPVGRKVLTVSQLKVLASQELRARYKREAEKDA